MNPKENAVLGFGEAQVFSEQIKKIDWTTWTWTNEEKLAYLKKIYRIVKGKSLHGLLHAHTSHVVKSFFMFKTLEPV